MKKLLFIVLILLSCEKLKDTEQCWTCTEKANMNITRTWETCDVLEAAKENGKRWVTYVWNGNIKTATVHTIECK